MNDLDRAALAEIKQGKVAIEHHVIADTTRALLSPTDFADDELDLALTLYKYPLQMAEHSLSQLEWAIKHTALGNAFSDDAIRAANEAAIEEIGETSRGQVELFCARRKIDPDSSRHTALTLHAGMKVGLDAYKRGAARQLAEFRSALQKKRKERVEKLVWSVIGVLLGIGGTVLTQVLTRKG